MTVARYQFTVTDEAGNIVPNATVTVRLEAGGAPLATLYSDRAGTVPIANPTASDTDGFVAFHVVGGAYRIDAVSGAFSRTWRYVAIGLAAETDYASTGLTWLFSTTTTDSDPGAGFMRFNNATLASVTTIYFDNLTRFGTDLSAWLNSLDDRGVSTDRGIITIQSSDLSAVFVGRVTGSVVDGSGYKKVSVTPLSTSGTFVAGATLSALFTIAPVDGTQAGTVFTFSSTTSMADPGTGTFRLNNATLASVTAAAIDDLSAVSGNPDVSAVVLSWDDSTNSGNRGYLTIRNPAAPQNFAVYKISGDSTDNSGWTQLALTHVASAGSLTNGTVYTFEFSPSGDRGNLEVAIAVQLDGLGAALTTGVKGDLQVPFACTINSVTMLADQSGSIVVDIWKDTYANYPPTVADTITASAKPTISSTNKSTDATLTGWNKSIAAGDTLRFNVDSITTIQRVTLILKVTKS